MGQMAKSIGGIEAERPLYKRDTEGDYYFQSLEALVERTGSRKMEAEKVGSGLLITALRIPRNRRDRLRRSKNNAWVEERIKGIEEYANNIVDQRLDDNCAFVGNLIHDEIGFPIFWAGAIPILWWPIKTGILKDIVFGDIHVLTIHNPAHFWQILRDKGFDVEVDERSRLVSARLTRGNAVYEFKNLEYLSRLIRFHLMSEDTIFEIIRHTLDQIKELGPETCGEVSIKPVVKLR